LRYTGNVCISGLTASGKTTHSHLLAGEFGLTYVSGSQIQLNFMGVSPIQSKDFWISERAKSFWNAHEFNRIDTELLRLE
jgi:cytidylate kinase